VVAVPQHRIRTLRGSERSAATERALVTRLHE
jgi:hypothetical protein